MAFVSSLANPDEAREITMPFKIWDNHFGGYMRDFDGGDVAEFQEKVEADRAIELFIRTRDRDKEAA
jgi:cell division septum initiation protein DivIVA